jgi:hypothetical protein
MADHAELGAMLNAINSGAICKFLGKPWNDENALTCLRDAFRLYEITRQNRELLLRLEPIDETTG